MQDAEVEVFLGIGSNLGHRFEHIRKVLPLIAKKALRQVRLSVIFETKAILPAHAPDAWNIPYLNLVIAGKTSLSPLSLLRNLKEIEKELGRDPHSPRWAPRIIDLDILAWGEKQVVERSLSIPHPELFNRPFFLSLMSSLQADWRYPVSGFPYSRLTLSEILHRHVNPHQGLIKSFIPFPQMVGVINITPDSFSDGGAYLHAEKAMEKVEELAKQGAAVIDLGAQSTRPNSIQISAKEEWNRLEPVLDLLKQKFSRLAATPQISLDSYYPEVIKKALKRYPIDWINDVKGGDELSLLQIAAERGCKIVLNHSLAIPPQEKTVLSFETSPITSLCRWAEKKLKQLKSLGIPPERIIFDPGIGFGKSACQSFSLLREIDHLKKIGCEILVGHSRKSFLKMISLGAPYQRDQETIGISHYLSKKGVDYLRVHNVEAHHQSLTAAAWLEGRVP